MVAVVERNPNLCIGGGVEEPFLARIFADRIGHGATRDAVVNLGPGLATVVRPPEVRVHVVEAQGIRVDMAYIQKLAADEARLQQEVANLKTWQPALASLWTQRKKALADPLPDPATVEQGVYAD